MRLDDISTTTRSPSATLTRHGRALRGSESVEVISGVATAVTCQRGKSMDKALDARSVTRSDKDRFEAAMTMAFSADPAARWAWRDPLQFMNIFMPLVTLFGGKSFEHGSAYVIGDFFGVAQWLPPGIQPDDGPIGNLFEQNMSEPKLSEVLFLFEQMAGFHPHEPHWYIPLIAVDPMFHGRGYGTELMRHGLVACDRDQHPAYLEATSPTNR